MQIVVLSDVYGLSTIIARMSKLHICSQVRAIVYCTLNNIASWNSPGEKKKRALVPQVRSHGDSAVSIILQMRLSRGVVRLGLPQPSMTTHMNA
jgi:hypothetical protein